MKYIFVYGNTYPLKEELKIKFNCQWDADRKAWVFLPSQFPALKSKFLKFVEKNNLKVEKI